MRKKWTFEEINAIYEQPLLQLISKAHKTHTEHHDPCALQVCHLISIKTGGCPEDCKYCAQSSRYQTSISATPMLSLEAVIADAKKAIARGATRICLGAAWRGVRDGKSFETVLTMVKAIAALGVEVCCTLGMLSEEHARRLKEAGLFAYNHNLDTSPSFYKTIITTRTYEDRLATLGVVANANLSVCCGGILGMGETIQDRLELLLALACLETPPESVPINQLSPIPGTPLAHQTKLSVWEVVRFIATTRLVLPQTMIRLSAGRIEMSYQEQALCFLAGANSIFAGEKLLTVANTPIDRDEEMFHLFGVSPCSKPACC